MEYPFLLHRHKGGIWYAGQHWYGLCSAWNYATSPSRPMTDREHLKARQYAKAIKNRMTRHGYSLGVHYKELSNGALWPIQPEQGKVA
jgi:hypothetical protein